MNDDTTRRQTDILADDRGELRLPLDPTRAVELTVSNPNGGVVVRGTDRDDALVRYTKQGRVDSRRYAEATLEVDGDDRRIDVRVRMPGSGGWADLDLKVDLRDFAFFKGGTARAEGGLGRALAEAREVIADVGRAIGDTGVWFDLELELPRAIGAWVHVRTASGDVVVEEIDGLVAVTTASGDARVRGVRDETALQTASGDLLAEAIAGRFSARSASGDIRLAAAHLDAFDLKTASGDVFLEAALAGEGPYRVQTVSGDVRLGLATPRAAEPNVSLEWKTVSGNGDVAAPFRTTGRRAWEAGAGGPRISVQTVSGDLLARGAPAPVAAPPATTRPSRPAGSTQPTPPTPPTPPMRSAGPPPSPPPPAEPVPPVPPVEPVEPVEPATVPEPEAAGEPIALGDPTATPPEGTTEAPAQSPADPARLAVLEAVERGEIDVEEALRRLDSDPGRTP